MQETWVQSLGLEDPMEKGKATHSSILAWRIPRTVQSTALQRVRHDWATFTSLHSDIHRFLLLQFISNPQSQKSNFSDQRGKNRKKKKSYHVLSWWTDGIDSALSLGNFISRELGISSREGLSFALQGTIGKVCKHFRLSQPWGVGEKGANGIQPVRSGMLL